MSLIRENTTNYDTEQLRNYLIEKSVGFGSFGKVKMATHIPTQEKVAIKIIESNNTKNSLTAKSEISILKKIFHPNIMQVFDIIHTNTKYYIISEFISGGELFSYIQKKSRLAQNDIAFLFFQIINALDYLHQKNIVHRDLKPENILLTKEKIIKIIDFGLAKEVTEKNIFLKTRCGSLCYSAPEMLKGEKYNGKLVDIWSIGVILFIMECGTYPFEDKNESVLIQKIVKGKINYPSFVPFIIKNLLQKMLVVNPKNRITIKELKEHSLYKHGKSLFLKDNVIYDSTNFLLRKDILKKAKDMIMKNEQMQDIVSNKILIDKMIKNTNWRLFSNTGNLNESDFNKLHNKNESDSSCVNIQLSKKLITKPKIKLKELNFYDHFPASTYRKHVFGTFGAVTKKIPPTRKTFQINNNHSFSSEILSLQLQQKTTSNKNTTTMNNKPLKFSGSHPVREYINLQCSKDNTKNIIKKEFNNTQTKHQNFGLKILKNTQIKPTKIISVKFVNQNSISASFNENSTPKKSVTLQRFSTIKQINQNAICTSNLNTMNRNIKQFKITNNDYKNKITLSSMEIQKFK